MVASIRMPSPLLAGPRIDYLQRLLPAQRAMWSLGKRHIAYRSATLASTTAHHEVYGTPLRREVLSPSKAGISRASSTRNRLRQAQRRAHVCPHMRPCLRIHLPAFTYPPSHARVILRAYASNKYAPAYKETAEVRVWRRCSALQTRTSASFSISNCVLFARS